MIRSTYGPFLAQLYQDKVSLVSNKKGADSWHIGFRVRFPSGNIASLTNDRSAQDLPFDDLSIYSTSVEGVIDVHVLNKPFISVLMFDKPRNWQAILEWLWDYGNRRYIEKAEYQCGSLLGSCIICFANARIASHSRSISKVKCKSE